MELQIEISLLMEHSILASRSAGCQSAAPVQAKGTLLLNQKGLFWRRSGGDKTLEVRKAGLS